MNRRCRPIALAEQSQIPSIPPINTTTSFRGMYSLQSDQMFIFTREMKATHMSSAKLLNFRHSVANAGGEVVNERRLRSWYSLRPRSASKMERRSRLGAIADLLLVKVHRLAGDSAAQQCGSLALTVWNHHVILDDHEGSNWQKDKDLIVLCSLLGVYNLLR